MTMTWQDYIAIRCGIGLVAFLVISISWVIITIHDNKKKNKPRKTMGEIFGWKE